MRGPGTYDAARLTDSSLVYMRSPPAFMRIFVVFVIVFLLAVTAWACVTTKTQEVNIQGAVSSEDATNVFSQVNGVVVKLYVDEGDSVVYGQSLLQFDSTDVEIALQDYQARIDQCDLNLSFISRMSDQLTGPDITVNPFGTVDAYEAEYHDIYEKFLFRYDTTDADQRRQLVNSELQTLENDRFGNMQNRDSYENDYSKTLNELSKYNVVSNTSGIVHFDDLYKEGVMLQAGNKICTINPEDGVKTVVAYISSHDRAKVEEGQACRFTVDGLVQNEFGSVEGVLSRISSDASVHEEQVVFRCEISFDKTKLVGDRGYEVSIVNGMTVNAWVIYEKITYMQYFLEKLGF